MTTSPRESPPSNSELASLVTSVGDSLVPIDTTQHGSRVLNTNNWGYVDPRTNLHSIQEQTAKDPGRVNYMEQIVDFQQPAAVAQQQLQDLSPDGAEERIPGVTLQMSPAGLGTENVISHPEQSHSQTQDHQASAETTDTSTDEVFDQADYVNDDSVSGQDVPEVDECDEIQEAEVEPSNVEEHIRGVGPAALSAQNDNEVISSETDQEDAMGDGIVLGCYTSPGPVSLRTTTSASAGDQRISEDALLTAQPGYAAATELSVDGLDIVKDKSKASNLIKALEDKGALAEILKGLGYQKSGAGCASIKAAPSVRSVASDGSVVCREPKCGKVFHRPCELK